MPLRAFREPGGAFVHRRVLDDVRRAPGARTFVAGSMLAAQAWLGGPCRRSTVVCSAAGEFFFSGLHIAGELRLMLQEGPVVARASPLVYERAPAHSMSPYHTTPHHTRPYHTIPQLSGGGTDFLTTRRLLARTHGQELIPHTHERNRSNRSQAHI